MLKGFIQFQIKNRTIAEVMSHQPTRCAKYIRYIFRPQLQSRPYQYTPSASHQNCIDMV